jgi:hypothetical protein
VAEAEVESLKLLYASVVRALLFLFLYEKYIIHVFPFFIALKRIIPYLTG